MASSRDRGSSRAAERCSGERNQTGVRTGTNLWRTTRDSAARCREHERDKRHETKTGSSSVFNLMACDRHGRDAGASSTGLFTAAQGHLAQDQRRSKGMEHSNNNEPYCYYDDAAMLVQLAQV